MYFLVKFPSFINCKEISNSSSIIYCCRLFTNLLNLFKVLRVLLLIS
nr:hypothetical protein CoNPh38_CDS0423 [Staphylococcus phage S-CoN_Ph38]